MGTARHRPIGALAVWKKCSRKIYQDPQNEVVRARAAKARRQMRSYLGGERAA